MSCPIPVISLIETLVLTWVGCPSLPTDYIRDPSTKPFTSLTTGLRARVSGFARLFVAVEGWWVNIQPRDGILGTILGRLSANVERGNGRASAKERSPFTFRGRGRHCGRGVSKQDIHILETNTAGLGIQEIHLNIKDTDEQITPRGMMGKRQNALTNDKTACTEKGMYEVQSPLDGLLEDRGHLAN